MDSIESYITPELLVMIPVMYLIGMMLKRSAVPDNRIPVYLGVISIVFAVIYEFSMMGMSMDAVFAGIIQGVLVAGASVYANQTYKQTLVKKGE